jgi:hypothetical protein
MILLHGKHNNKSTEFYERAISRAKPPHSRQPQHHRTPYVLVTGFKLLEEQKRYLQGTLFEAAPFYHAGAKYEQFLMSVG